MQNALKILPATQTMSSVEIAALTGRQHKHVLESIRSVLAEAGISAAGFSAVYKNQQDRDTPCFKLPFRETNLVISGFSVQHRLAIIDRWQELEKQKTLPSYADTLRLYADSLEKIETQSVQIKTKDQLLLASNEASIKAGEVMVREFVKTNDLIDIGEKLFYQWMRDQNIIMQHKEPYQKFVNLGYFHWKPGSEEYGGKIRHQLYITPRGKVWLAAKYMAFLDRDMAA